MPRDPWLFFPGIIFHELSHVIACLITGVKVHKVKWFGTDEAYVQHAKPNAWQGLVISLAPFLVGNAVAFELLGFGHSLAIRYSPWAILVYWFSFSLLLYSFPSKQDALNAFNSFTDFYKRHILEQGAIWERLFWLLTFPVFFVPIIVMLGLILLFDSAYALRIFWVVGVILYSFRPTLLF